jgi:hypothetical protein
MKKTMIRHSDRIIIPDIQVLGHGNNDTPAQAKWRRYCDSGQRDADAAVAEAEAERRGRYGPEMPFTPISAASARQYGHLPGAPGIAKSDAERYKQILDDNAISPIVRPMPLHFATYNPSAQAEEQSARLEGVLRARAVAQEAAAARNERRREAQERDKERDKERRRLKRQNERARKRNK